MRRVLVTGASGCIGRQAVPILAERGWELHGVAFGEPPSDMPRVTWHVGNLLEPADVTRVVAESGADALLHLAWFIAPGQWARAPQNLDWVTAGIVLARAFREAGGRRMVVSGSCLEYDWDYGFCSERLTPCQPHTLYGTAKHALRLLLEAYSRESGLSLGWGRVFFLFGPWEHPDRLVASVIRALLRGERARCSHGTQVRDYLYSGSVARALVALLESEVTGPVNIGSGRPITLRQLALRAAELLGQPDRVDFGAIPAASTDKPLVVADIGRLTSEVCWSEAPGLDEGLEETIRWWRGRQAAEEGRE